MILNWDSKELIGRGGNGRVYRIENTEGEIFAVKVLTRLKNDKAYKRFRDEIKILEHLKDVKGIIKIIEYNLSSSDTAYYIMPLAIRLEDYLSGIIYTQFYSIILKLAQALVQLHEFDITHRDIKPDNILIIDDEPVFSDFGLAHFPKKEKISNDTEKIGAVWTIAPEMKRISSTAQFKKADIYSFAKTLWILITNQRLGFEGQYILNSSISISNFVDLKINDHHRTFGEWRYESFVLLESLLVDATDNNPDNRPNALEFYSRISEWYNTSSILAKRNVYEWEHYLTRIFPVSIPESSTWTNLKEIYTILELVSKEYDQLNYSFLPEHGGTDITKIEYAKEKNGLIINDYYLINPDRLTFESMSNLDFSYFYLELNNLKPIDDLQENFTSEFLYLKENGNYSTYETIGKKKTQRYLKGSLVITRKTSIINKVRGNYDGHLGIHHNKTPHQYKELIKKLMILFKKYEQNACF